MKCVMSKSQDPGSAVGHAEAFVIFYLPRLLLRQHGCSDVMLSLERVTLYELLFPSQ